MAKGGSRQAPCYLSQCAVRCDHTFTLHNPIDEARRTNQSRSRRVRRVLGYGTEGIGRLPGGVQFSPFLPCPLSSLIIPCLRTAIGVPLSLAGCPLAANIFHH